VEARPVLWFVKAQPEEMVEKDHEHHVGKARKIKSVNHNRKAFANAMARGPGTTHFGRILPDAVPEG
jgi:hypothetical protein